MKELNCTFVLLGKLVLSRWKLQWLEYICLSQVSNNDKQCRQNRKIVSLVLLCNSAGLPFLFVCFELPFYVYFPVVNFISGNILKTNTVVLVPLIFRNWTWDRISKIIFVCLVFNIKQLKIVGFHSNTSQSFLYMCWMFSFLKFLSFEENHQHKYITSGRQCELEKGFGRGSHGPEMLHSLLAGAAPVQQKEILGEHLYMLVHELKA